MSMISVSRLPMSRDRVRIPIIQHIPGQQARRMNMDTQESLSQHEIGLEIAEIIILINSIPKCYNWKGMNYFRIYLDMYPNYGHQV